MESDEKVIHLFSFYDWGYSRSATFLTGILNKKQNLVFHRVDTGFLKSLRNLRKTVGTIDKKLTCVVLSGSNVIALYLRVLGMRNIVLDAGWSSFEASKSRSYGLKKPVILMKLYLIDLFSFLSAKKVILESESQRKYASKVFFSPRAKTFSIPTGLNECEFDLEERPRSFSEIQDKNWKSLFLFRGKNVFESGLSVIAHASWLLPKEIGVVIVTDDVRDLKFNSENSFILEGHQDSKTLAYLYRNSTAAIGQISDSKRIINTIPHKAYEAAYFSKPYIAMWNSAIFEFFTREALFSLTYPTADNLAEIMKQIHQFPDDAKERGLLFGQEYQSRYRQVKLQKEFLEIISPLN